MTKPVKLLGYILRLSKLLFVSALLLASLTPSWALAQTVNDPWTKPLNLSHSGVAINPAIVIDSDAVVHAVWQDDLANFVYTRRDGDEWSMPETTDLNLLFRMPSASEPQGQSPVVRYIGPNPLFIAGAAQHIFAVWISPEGRLFTSIVENQNFQKLTAWEPRRLITLEAASFAAVVDARGELHLAFLSTTEDPENPPGIYYTRSKNSGRSWTLPMLLYESPYFRRLSEGEANLSLATAGPEEALHVYVAWDNRPRKQVFLTQSENGGQNWEPPALIAGPASSSGTAGPSNIHVAATQNSVVLIWQGDRATNGLLPACSKIYQSSIDAGTTWSDPQLISEDLSGCAQSFEFVIGLPNIPEEPLYFLTESKSQVSLIAWNGLQWSQPQAQPILSGFEEPEIYTEVLYGCHSTSLLGERLYVLGCDQGEGGDIWVTSRELGSKTSWFKPPAWSRLSPVSSDNLEMEAMELAATDDGIIHAFFSQLQDPEIYYTYWDAESWSHITPVMKLPDGEAGWPAIAAGPGNELFLIAPNNRGALYFSRATSGNADSESLWSTPTRLGAGHDGEIGSADIASDAAGTVYVAYSVPVNEQRGIYLVQSKDNGTSWSEPVKFFDGATAGFDFVGAPSLLASSKGLLDVVWKEQSIRGDGVPQPGSLYYTRSENGGRTFTEAKLVVEEAVAWREIMMDGKGQLHLLWQPQTTLMAVWDQVSLDGGHTWQYPKGLPDAGSLTAVTRDPAGRLHLVGIGPDALGHWLWDGSRWQSEAPLSLPLSSQQESQVALLAAVTNKQGKMMVVLAKQTGEGNAAERSLLYSTHMLELLRNQSATQEVLTPTLPPTRITPATSTPAPLPTPTTLVDNPSGNESKLDPVETKNPISLFIMALVPVALLLLTVVGFVIRRAARMKDR